MGSHTSADSQRIKTARAGDRLTIFSFMAMKESREILIDASPETILAVLVDVEALPSWSPVHKRAEVIDTYPDGRPHHVRMTVRVMGITDEQLLEYKWGPDWVVWDALAATRERAQHAEYTLQPGLDGTLVRFDLTFEPALPVPAFLADRANNTFLEAAVEGLRNRVIG
jgi:uncharacterized protein YndB with AHSA1/START domain